MAVRKLISAFLNVFKVQGKLRDLIMWPIASRLLARTYQERMHLKSGHEITADMSDSVGRTLLFYGEQVTYPWEPVTTQFVEERIRDAQVTIMGGAHIGYTLLSMAMAKKAGAKIYAFEPVQYLYDLARVNSAYEDVTLEHMAIGDTTGTVLINVDGVRSSIIKDAKLEGKPQEEVRITTLDDYCQKKFITNVDLIFLDVEGFELNVLQGAAHIFNQTKKPVIIFELLTRGEPALQSPIVQFLTGRGYECKVIDDEYTHPGSGDRSGSLIPLNDYVFPEGVRYINIYAKPR